MNSQTGASKATLPILIVISVILAAMLQFGFIFLLLALMPAIVAYSIDIHPGKPSFKIVLAGNLAATLPSLAPMLRASLKMKHYDISGLLHDPNIWLFVYSGAAAAWCVIFACRVIARFLVTITYEYNIISLENFQKRLVAEWGQKIMEG